MRAEVPQGSVLGSILYLKDSCDIPAMKGVTGTAFADDTALLCIVKHPVISASKVQSTSNRLLKSMKN